MRERSSPNLRRRRGARGGGSLSAGWPPPVLPAFTGARVETFGTSAVWQTNGDGTVKVKAFSPSSVTLELVHLAQFVRPPASNDTFLLSGTVTVAIADLSPTTGASTTTLTVERTPARNGRRPDRPLVAGRDRRRADARGRRVSVRRKAAHGSHCRGRGGSPRSRIVPERASAASGRFALSFELRAPHDCVGRRNDVPGRLEREGLGSQSGRSARAIEDGLVDDALGAGRSHAVRVSRRKGLFQPDRRHHGLVALIAESEAERASAKTPDPGNQTEPPACNPETCATSRASSSFSRSAAGTRRPRFHRPDRRPLLVLRPHRTRIEAVPSPTTNRPKSYVALFEDLVGKIERNHVFSTRTGPLAAKEGADPRGVRERADSR